MRKIKQYFDRKIKTRGGGGELNIYGKNNLMENIQWRIKGFLVQRMLIALKIKKQNEQFLQQINLGPKQFLLRDIMLPRAV